jgi:hypothetical protein
LAFEEGGAPRYENPYRRRARHRDIEEAPLLLDLGRGAGTALKGIPLDRRYRRPLDLPQKLIATPVSSRLGLYPNGVLVQTPGLFGGRAGVLPGAAVRNSRDGQTAEIGIGALVTLTSPDEVAELRLAGGSGFGDPLQRSIEAVQRDLDDGYLTLQGARRDYGCVAGPGGVIDPGASRELRRRLASEVAKQPKAEAR